MNQAIRVEPAQKSKRLLALLIDVIVFVIGSLALFFVLLYGVFGPIFNYSSRVDRVSTDRAEYNLNLPSGETYDKYAEVIEKFYFEYFPSEIEESIKSYYPSETYTSVAHIYNVFVLSLPYAPEPTGDNYRSDLFQYKLDADGKVLKDEIGEIRKDKSGETFERYLSNYMYSKYVALPDFLDRYKADYHEANLYKNNLELTSRAVASGLTVIIAMIIIPLCYKNGQTIGNRIFKVAVVNNKNGFIIKPYQTILRGAFLYALPILGVTLYNRYSLIIFTVFPLFINVLLMLFRASGRDLADIVSGTCSVDKDNTLFFKSAGEASLFEKKKENQVVEDQEYLDKLKATETVELETSRDEEFKKKNKK